MPDAAAEIHLKRESGEWVAMYSYYSVYGCSWVTVYGTPEQLQEIQDAGGFAPPLLWRYGYPPMRGEPYA